jgi:hypothetical protein
VLGITSIRPDGVPVEAVTDLLAELAADPATTPDLVSINLGHIVVWEPPAGPNGRRTGPRPERLRGRGQAPRNLPAGCGSAPNSA